MTLTLRILTYGPHQYVKRVILGVACLGLSFYGFRCLVEKLEHSGVSPSVNTDPIIPRKIWYKLGPKGLSNETRTWTETCIESNSDYAVTFMTDDSSDAYVKHAFSMYPELVKTYLSLRIPILRADLLRYLLLFVEGGIWLDLDVSCEGIPMDEWIPRRYRAEASLVLGWEFDVGGEEFYKSELASWTIMAKPRSLHLWTVIRDILQNINGATRDNNVTVAELTLAMVGDVVLFAGPWRMTQSVFNSLETTYNMAIDYAKITHLAEPKLVGDVLILPAHALAAATDAFENEVVASDMRLVTHHYAGSWKNDAGGETI